MATKDSGTTLVRGADGKLYVVSTTGATTLLQDDKAKKVEAALPELQKQMEAILGQNDAMVAAGCNQHVQIIIPDIKVGG